MFFSGRSIFTVKNVEISKDFEIDREKIIEYLEIYPQRLIWKYDTKLMEQRMSKQFFLEEYRIFKKYPNTIAIKIKIRKPIAKTVGYNSRIYVIDKDGIVFRQAHQKDSIYPLLLYSEREKIKSGIQISGVYKNVIDVLYNLRKTSPDIYNGISQIEIFNSVGYGLNYIINYKTLYQRIYLKNKIDVNSIRRGLSCILFLEDTNYSVKKLLYTGNGFIF